MMWGWAAWHMLYAVRESGRVWGIDPIPEHCEWVRARSPANLIVAQCHASNQSQPPLHRCIDHIVDSAVHFIKIDTDSPASDFASLAGARQTILKWRPVITVQEISADISAFMQDCGYRCDDASRRYDRLWRPEKSFDN